jgi:hypothetical protein
LQNDENRIDVNEGMAVAIPLQRNNGAAGSVSVLWQALAKRQDFAPSTGNVTFTAGQLSAMILIYININADNENLEVTN